MLCATFLFGHFCDMDFPSVHRRKHDAGVQDRRSKNSSKTCLVAL